MDSMQVQVVRRTVRLAGVRCELTALRMNESGFQAIWQCPSCTMGDSSKTNFPHSTAALDWAERCARSHCERDHSSPQVEGAWAPLSA